MRALSSTERNALRDAVLQARRSAECSSLAALNRLGVEDEEAPSHLDENERALRTGLREKLRQLDWKLDLLTSECAYEQWHRLLFARFLAENDLLLHPDFRAPVTLSECEELAEELGEPDGWAVAGRFAAEILPGIFRLDDPCVRLRLAPEGRVELEEILAALNPEVFAAEDSLGWVYQFWQKDRKDAINDAGIKIGAAELGPVTQLFTENYMVRFLLENSLGAWWATHHPHSPLLSDYEFLRFEDDGKPAAGAFEGWPQDIAEVSVMDPCCGSGHFLVEAFGMLWRMRAEEEGLEPIEAQDAVLKDNLFGLELDPRCVQIAMFAIALSAWKAGGGWRELPTPNIACSGIPAKAPVDEWKELAHGDQRLESALERLHTLFKDADTLGSLIDPKRTTEGDIASKPQRSLEDVDWEEVAPLLEQAAEAETDDPASAVLGASAAGIAKAADLLSRSYVLVATNVPYLTRTAQAEPLRAHLDVNFGTAAGDLATTFIDRYRWNRTIAVVSPQNWLFLVSYKAFRERLLSELTWSYLVALGPGAFAGISGEVVKATLFVATSAAPPVSSAFMAKDLAAMTSVGAKAHAVSEDPVVLAQASQLSNPDARIVFAPLAPFPLLETVARSFQGVSPADTPRFSVRFWEVAAGSAWVRWQGPPTETVPFGGRSNLLRWGSSLDAAVEAGAAFVRGEGAWSRPGVVVRQVGDLPATLYTGERFDTSCAAVVPDDPALVPALWQFLASPGYRHAVRQIDRKLNVTNATLAKVPFDVDHWRKVADEAGPLPEPFSDDPTQWLFEGRPEISTEPLQVAAGRLLGYRWPEQAEDDDLDDFADPDGIVCLPALGGLAPPDDRLIAALAKAFGGEWSSSKATDLIAATGSKRNNLADWLREDFFKQHCKLFANRPFIWHISDGRRDGFSALVNYHRLDHSGLEKLIYTYLWQGWIERQRAELRDEKPGAEARLAAAEGLKDQLEKILQGDPPYDIYVRWKELHEQPIGWDPDLDDGVRLNVRPFVEAGVLRSKFTVKWGIDRGKNPDGGVRDNDLHLTRAEKEQAREKARGVAG